MTIISDPLTSYYTTVCVSITEFKWPLLLHVQQRLRESLFYKFRSIKNVKGVLERLQNTRPTCHGTKFLLPQCRSPQISKSKMNN